MTQTAQASFIQDVVAPPAESKTATEPATLQPAKAAKKTASKAPALPPSDLPLGIITMAVLVCMLLCGLAWYAYRH